MKGTQTKTEKKKIRIKNHSKLCNSKYPVSLLKGSYGMLK